MKALNTKLQFKGPEILYTEVEWAEAVEWSSEDSSKVGAVGYSFSGSFVDGASSSLVSSFSSSDEFTSAWKIFY